MQLTNQFTRTIMVIVGEHFKSIVDIFGITMVIKKSMLIDYVGPVFITRACKRAG